MKRIKAYTAAVLTAVITLSAVPVVFAADTLDSADVKELLYKSNIAGRADYAELSGYDYVNLCTRDLTDIMLGNILDEHLWTYGVDPDSVGMHGNYGGNDDMTVIDYIRGGKLNGVLSQNAADEQALIDKYLSWYYPAAGDILYEYYGDDSPELIAKMEKYGWKRK